MAENFNHDKTTKINAIMILQRRALQKQIDCLQNIAGVTQDTLDITISNSLIQRLDTTKKVVDEFEMTILGTLDVNGKISSVQHLQDLMFLMTRIIKVSFHNIVNFVAN